eukprot:6201107-Pleurochrysis_carterae.AAC.2
MVQRWATADNRRLHNNKSAPWKGHAETGEGKLLLAAVSVWPLLCSRQLARSNILFRSDWTSFPPFSAQRELSGLPKRKSVGAHARRTLIIFELLLCIAHRRKPMGQQTYSAPMKAVNWLPCLAHRARTPGCGCGSDARRADLALISGPDD